MLDLDTLWHFPCFPQKCSNDVSMQEQWCGTAQRHLLNVLIQRAVIQEMAVLWQVTPLGPPKLLEKMSEVLVAVGDPSDRGHSSAQLREVMLPHLEPQEAASLDAMLRRLDTLCDAVVAKACPFFALLPSKLAEDLSYGARIQCPFMALCRQAMYIIYTRLVLYRRAAPVNVH